MSCMYRIHLGKKIEEVYWKYRIWVVCTEFFWVRKQFQLFYWITNVCRGCGISWPAERLTACQKGICCYELGWHIVAFQRKLANETSFRLQLVTSYSGWLVLSEPVRQGAVHQSRASQFFVHWTLLQVWHPEEKTFCTLQSSKS